MSALKIAAVCGVALFGWWVFQSQETGRARAAQRAAASAADQARHTEIIRRGAVIRSERKFEDFILRTVEMPKRTDYGTEIVTCFLFDAPHAASITCQEIGEPVL